MKILALVFAAALAATAAVGERRMLVRRGRAGVKKMNKDFWLSKSAAEFSVSIPNIFSKKNKNGKGRRKKKKTIEAMAKTKKTEENASTKQQEATSHADKGGDFFSTIKPGDNKFTILLYDNVNLLDVFGPMQMILSPVGLRHFELTTCAMTPPCKDSVQNSVCQTNGPTIIADFSKEDCPTEFTTLVVPGGKGAQAAAKSDLQWLADRVHLSKKVVTFGTGGNILEQVIGANHGIAEHPKFLSVGGGTIATDSILKFIDAYPIAYDGKVEKVKKYAEYTPAPAELALEPIAPPEPYKKTPKIAVLIYDGFDVLDVFGPISMFSSAGIEIVMCSVPPLGMPKQRRFKHRTYSGSSSPYVVADYGLEDCPPTEYLFVPGGAGTGKLYDQHFIEEVKPEVFNRWKTTFFNQLRKRVDSSKGVLTVCTGSLLLGASGVLDGIKATTNKMFWCSAVDDLNKEKSEDDRIEWQPAARWVVDSKGNTKFWTSSGVSAGTDMSLAFIENVEGDSFRKERARFAAWENKYNWNDESENDPFRKQWRHGWC